MWAVAIGNPPRYWSAPGEPGQPALYPSPEEAEALVRTLGTGEVRHFTPEVRLKLEDWRLLTRMVQQRDHRTRVSDVDGSAPEAVRRWRTQCRRLIGRKLLLRVHCQEGIEYQLTHDGMVLATKVAEATQGGS